MQFEQISYSIKPSFAPESVCSFCTDRRKDGISIYVMDGNGQRRIQVLEESVSPLLEAITQLKLPVPDDFLFGLDGTRYELKIGVLSGVTYSWWETLPHEWAALENIISMIEVISGIQEQKS
jgi:hypothetical protein